MFAKLYSWYSSSWGLSIPFLIIIMTSTSCSYHHHDHQPNLLLIRTSTSFFQGQHQLSRKSEKNKSFWPNQSAPFIYIMIELCYFSLYQWGIRIHLLWGECFNIPHHCDPHLNQTKFNDLLPLTIDGVLANASQCPILTQYTASSSRNAQLSQLDLVIIIIILFVCDK